MNLGFLKKKKKSKSKGSSLGTASTEHVNESKLENQADQNEVTTVSEEGGTNKVALETTNTSEPDESKLKAQAVEKELIIAAKNGDLNKLKKLISSGANKDAKDEVGYTPLLWAACRGHFEVCHYLLEIGANKNIEDEDGWTALTAAINNNHAHIVSLLSNENMYQSSVHSFRSNAEAKNDMTELSGTAERKSTHRNSKAGVLEEQSKREESQERESFYQKRRSILEDTTATEELTKDIRITFRNLCKNGNAEDLKILFRDYKGSKSDLFVFSDEESSPLHLASENENADVVEELVKMEEIDINYQNTSQETALHSAARAGFDKIVRILLFNKARPDLLDKFGNTPLHNAVLCPSENALQELLEAQNFSDFLDIRNDDSKTALHIAAELGLVNIVEELTKHKADQTLTDKKEWMPVHYAVLTGNIQLIKLLKSNAQVCMEHKIEQTLLDIAMDNHHTAAIKTLWSSIPHSEQKEILKFVSKNRRWNRLHEAVFICLVDNKVKIDDEIKIVISTEASTQISTEASTQHTNLSDETSQNAMDSLPEKNEGAVIGKEYPQEASTQHTNLCDETSQNAMDSLTEKNEGAVIGEECPQEAEHIVEDIKASDIEEPKNENDSGEGEEEKATIQSSHSIKDFLLEKDTNERTPLLLAFSLGNDKEVLEALVREGAELDTIDQFGMRPLHMLCCHGDTTQLEYLQTSHLSLLKKYVNSTCRRNDNDVSPLYLAAERGHNDMVKILLENQAKLGFTDSHGWTPLHIAIINGNDETVEQLVHSDEAKDVLRIGVENQKTPLHVAICSRQNKAKKTRIVEALLKPAFPEDKADHLFNSILQHAVDHDKHQVTTLANFLTNLKGQDEHVQEGGSLLHLVVQNGFKDVVKKLAEESQIQNPNLKNSQGDTALHLAVKNCSVGLEIVDYLLSAGSDMSVKNNDGKTALHIAVETNNVEVVRKLLQETSKKKKSWNLRVLRSGSDSAVYIPDQSGNTALHLAVLKGSIEIVRELLKLDVELKALLIPNNNSDTPLHLAILVDHRDADADYDSNKNKDIIQIFVEKAAESKKLRELLSCVNEQNFTPLHLAIFHNKMEAVELFLDDKHKDVIEIQKKTEGVNTPLHLACEKGFQRIVEDLIAYAQRNTTKEKVKKILNSTNSEQKLQTPLHLAVTHKHLDIVKILKANGASLDIADAEGKTPLHLAAMDGGDNGPELCKRLVQGETNLKETLAKCCKNKDRTALHEAVMQENIDTIKILVEAKAKVDVPDSDGVSPLSFACLDQKPEILEALFFISPQNYVNNPYCEEKRTFLHVAAAKGHTRILEILLDKGANLLSDDAQKNTPLHLASKAGQYEIVKKIIDFATKTGEPKLPSVPETEEEQEQAKEEQKAFSLKDFKWLPLPIQKPVTLSTKITKQGKENVNMSKKHMRQSRSQKRSSKGLLMNDELENEHGRSIRERASSSASLAAGMTVNAKRNGVTLDKLLEPLNIDGFSPLHLAVVNGKAKVVEIFAKELEKCVDVRTKDGDAPIHLAIQNGFAEVLEILIARGAFLKAKNKKDQVPLQLALTAKNLEMVQMLVKKDITVLTHYKVNDSSQNNPLHEAARNGYMEIANFLIKNDPEKKLLEDKNKKRQTPLHAAGIGGYNEMFQLLSKHSTSKASELDDDGNTPRALLEKAERYNNFAETFFRLCKEGNKEQALEILKEGEYEKHLLNFKRRRDPADFSTPLHEVARNLTELDFSKEQQNQKDLLELLEQLLVNGANPNAENKNKETPLNLVSRSISATETFLKTIAKHNIELRPNPRFTHMVMNLQEFQKKIKEQGQSGAGSEILYTSYYIFILDSLGQESNLSIDLNLQVSKTAKRIDDVVFKVCQEAKNPVFHLVQSAAAMEQRAVKTPMLKDDFYLLKSKFFSFVHKLMDIEEMDDIRNTLEVLGASQNKPSKFLESGPFALALKLRIGEVIALPQSQEALKLAWGYERFLNALISSSLEWDTSIYKSDGWKFDIYRKIPSLHALVSFILHLIFLLCTYRVLFGGQSAATEIFLLLMVLGYLVQEIHQIRHSDYTQNSWNIWDIVILCIFFCWFVLYSTKKTLPGGLEISNIVLSVNSFFILFRLLNYASVSENSGILVAVLLEMMGVVMRFLALFCVLIWGFSIIFTVTFPDIPTYQTIPDSLLTLFGSSLGDFDLHAFDKSDMYWIGLIVLIIYLVVAMVILMNILIALLSATFNDYQTKQYQNYCLLFASFVVEYHQKDDDSWLPAPLCLFNGILFPLTFLKKEKVRVQEFRKFVVSAVDVLVAVSIVLPLCWILRSWSLLRPQNWRKAFEAGSYEFAVYLAKVFLLSPFLFTPWFVFKAFGWTSASDLIFPFIVLEKAENNQGVVNEIQAIEAPQTAGTLDRSSAALSDGTEKGGAEQNILPEKSGDTRPFVPNNAEMSASSPEATSIWEIKMQAALAKLIEQENAQKKRLDEGGRQDQLQVDNNQEIAQLNYKLEHISSKLENKLEDLSSKLENLIKKINS